MFSINLEESGGPDPQNPKAPFRFRDEDQPIASFTLRNSEHVFEDGNAFQLRYVYQFHHDLHNGGTGTRTTDGFSPHGFTNNHLQSAHMADSEGPDP